jgi:hypothetical protein
MFVVGVVLCGPPPGPVTANPALVRDIVSLVAALVLLLYVFISGLTMASVIVLAAYYILLTGTSHIRCAHHMSIVLHTVTFAALKVQSL